jgi:PAS domain S-box-containing protein
VSAPRWTQLRAGLAATGAVMAALSILESGLLEPGLAQRTSDVLQLLLSVGAAAACLLAAARLREARAFWSALGLGALSWAVGQAFWVTRGVPFALEAAYPEADLLFTSSTALFLVAFVMRPGRAGGRPLTVAVDVTVLAIAMLYLFCQMALVHLLAGDLEAYEIWSTFVFDLRGLALLPAIPWALRYSDRRWQPLQARLAPAFLLLQLGGIVTNQSFAGGIAGRYHPGFYDLPWTLPFVWIALVAARFRPARAGDAAPAAARHGWRSTRRATVAAFAAVLLFPLVHVLVSWDDTPESPLARSRAAFALAGTLLVAGLYLLRQQITLRQAERVLREGEERYRALTDTGTDVVGVYGPDMRVRYVSGAILPTTGYRPDERIGRGPLELVHPDDADTLSATVAAVLGAPGEHVRAAIRARHKDGSWRDLELDVVNRLDEPAVRGIVANFRDVTEGRRAEEERERSRSLLEATLESTADGILVVGRSGRVVRFNQRLAAMWGLAPEQLANADFERVLALVVGQLEEPNACLGKLDRLHTDPEAESFDTLRLRDGRVFERYSLPQRLAGEVVGRVYSYRDVSERAHAEQAMARLVAIIEATPDFVGTCDAALRPLYVNRAFRRVLGLAPDEPLEQRSIAEFHPSGAATRLLEEAIPTALGEGAWSGENLLRHRDGHEVPVLQTVLAHRSAGGEVESFSTIARDISQRIEAERELRRAHTMAALGSLVAGVAHEVRNPLFGISSTLDAFEARFAKQEDHHPYAQVFREQLERLTSLMNDLLDYARPTSVELRPGRLEDVVARALSACARLAEASRVTIEARLAGDLPPLRMDAARLTQALCNLLENALHQSAAGGRVTLEARLVAGAGAPCVECSVEDEGPGFGPEELSRVFEPFCGTRQGGTGLRLAIAQRIVTDHLGTIGADNRPSGGARLSFRLPAAVTAA